MAVLAAMALSWLSARSELTASLITCYPGPEIYELCGHSAIRVRGEGIDSVWNFGIFDFTEPNFVYRFVKGETDYRCAAYPFAWFLPEYKARGSRVVEQDLNLTQQETQHLLNLLRRDALPENAKYRYNYVKDNCAIRILDRMDGALGEKIAYPDTVAYGTFRNEMRKYHSNYPWYQFGIDLALGSGLDYPISAREEMFVPMDMMREAAGARLSDGRPLIKDTRVLNEGIPNAILPPTSWWLTPLFWGWIIFVCAIILCACEFKSKKIYPVPYAFWFSILGLGGILISFLVFVSSHEATSPNVLIFWLNPLQFVFVAGICIVKLKPGAIVMAWYNSIVIAVLLLIWPFITQSANPAFFPLMGATLAMAATYAIIAHKSSYNNK